MTKLFESLDQISPNFSYFSMEIIEFISKNKEIYLPLMNFIEASDDQDQEFQKFIKILETGSVLTDKQQLSELFKIIPNIESNYHRQTNSLIYLRKLLHFT